MIPQDITPDQLNKYLKGTHDEQVGLEFTKVESGYLEATIPVDHRTKQPFGILHGGVTAALAESLGSVGSQMLIDGEKHQAVGTEITCNHLRSVTGGTVTGKAKIKHQGKTIHLWDIDVFNDKERLIAVAKLVVMVIPKRK